MNRERKRVTALANVIVTDRTRWYASAHLEFATTSAAHAQTTISAPPAALERDLLGANLQARRTSVHCATRYRDWFRRTADQLIASNRATPEELRDILRDIGREDERATRIVDRVRAMLKKQDIDKRPLDVFAVVRESVAFLAHDAAARQVQIECRLPSPCCFVIGDQVLLQQVVVNLVLNAFDAMGEDAAADRRVVIEAVPGSAIVEISVRDSGPGVPVHLADGCSNHS